jgi:hypothetical protein
MSLPNEPDFALVRIGSGPTPPIVCGIESISLNQTANTSDRFRRDCAKPGEVPTRKVRVTGRQWDVTGSGVINIDEFDTFEDSLGTSKAYTIEFGKRDGSDAGVIVGKFVGNAVMTAANLNMGDDEGTAEITLAGEGPIVWTPTP